jgi:hypothetical protein
MAGGGRPSHRQSKLNEEVKMVEYLMISNIASLNDTFRRSGFGVTMTQGVRNLPDLDGLMSAIRDFNRFNEDNDPYGERDFGSLDWYGEKVFWKIDYYNRELSCYEDPLSPTCQRVLTVMCADEY